MNVSTTKDRSLQVFMLLTNGFDPDVRVYKEAKYLVSKGTHVRILCWDRDPKLGYPEIEILESIEIVRFRIPSVAGSGIKQLPAFCRYIRACRKYLCKHKCDYLHCNDIDGAIAGALARSNKTTIIFDMHEFYEKGGKFQRAAWRKLTLHFIHISHAALYENDVYLSAPYKKAQDKLFPLKNYPDTCLIQILPKSKSDIFRIGYHGAVRSQIPEFTALFEAVKGMDDIRVDINGGGPDLNRLKELESRYENVHVNGIFNGISALSGLYKKTDILFCGYNPKDPNMQCTAEIVKYFEAIITGTPMIMTESLGMGEKVRNNGFGIACDTRDSQAIHQAIIKLKSDNAFWMQCSNNEKSQAHLYDWNEAVRILDKVYSL